MKTAGRESKSSSNQPRLNAGKKGRVAVIGSGVAGLATAIRLASDGYRVQVFETAGQPGGKVGEHWESGYRFGLGPSLFTLPELLDDLFRYAGADPDQYYRYHRLDLICRYFFPDGKVLNAWAEPDRLAKEFEAVLGEPAGNVHRYLAKVKRIYDLTEPIFLQSSLHDWRTYWRAPWLKSLAGLPGLDALRTMNASNERLFKMPNSVQLFNRYATYNGSNPYKAPATLQVIGHLEYNLGAYFLNGGMRTLVNAMHKLAVDLGVEFFFNTPVQQILLSEDQKIVRGITAASREIPADLVVSNMDIVPTYRQLLPGSKHPEKLLNQPRSTSALIFYWGMDREYPALDLHNILFSSDYEGEFGHLTETRTLSDDPTVYLYISSKAEPGHAPRGGENWFAMINVPHIAGQDWDELIERARAQMIRKIESTLGLPVAAHIRTEHRLDPRGIAARTSSHLGALYGNSSNNRFAAFLRHPNFSRNIRGLYFCGGSVHPGGGIPLCMLSARIVSEQVRIRS